MRNTRIASKKTANTEVKRPKVKKGDDVVIIAGKDRGRRGKVLDVDAKAGRVTVEKLNEYKKHQKPTQKAPGGIITIAVPIDISNVMVVDRSTNKPSRVGRKTVGDKNLRYAKASGQLIDSE